MSYSVQWKATLWRSRNITTVAVFSWSQAILTKSGAQLGSSPSNNIGAIGSPASLVGRQTRGRQPQYEVNGKACLTGRAHFWVFLCILFHMCGLLKWNWNKTIWTTSTWNCVSVLFQFHFTSAPGFMDTWRGWKMREQSYQYMQHEHSAWMGMETEYSDRKAQRLE